MKKRNSLKAKNTCIRAKTAWCTTAGSNDDQMILVITWVLLAVNCSGWDQHKTACMAFDDHLPA